MRVWVILEGVILEVAIDAAQCEQSDGKHQRRPNHDGGHKSGMVGSIKYMISSTQLRTKLYLIRIIHTKASIIPMMRPASMNQPLSLMSAKAFSATPLAFINLAT